MNDKWQRDGKRWSVRERDRVAERFRSYVRTPSNPRGRIHREPCFFCKKPKAEAHHRSYDEPFVVAWVCYRHHRMVDHGSLYVPQRAWWDYTSLVRHLWRPRLYGNKNAVRDSVVSAVVMEAIADGKVEGVPF